MATVFFYASKLLAAFMAPLGFLLLAGAVLLVFANPWRQGTQSPRLRRPGAARGARGGKGPTGDAPVPSGTWSAGMPAWAWWSALGLWGILYLLSCPLICDALLAGWEQPLSPDPVQGYDAVVVLGGMVVPDAIGQPMLPAGAAAAPVPAWPAQLQVNDAAERLIEAARLWHLGVAPLVIVSGGSGDLYQPDLREAGLMQALMQALGVPASAIIAEDQSRNTRENLVNVQTILRERGFKRILVVSSALHLRRVAGICRKLFDGQILSGQDKPVVWAVHGVDTCRTQSGFPEALLPSSRALDLSSRTIREMVGYVSYAFMGYL